ncbi:hypothetical protein BH23ACT3_BH23ACT3_09010 [soil metagenome]
MIATPSRREAIAVGVVLIATIVVVFLIRRPGHWWGDDWALYVRQAESVLSGGIGDVVADNRFTVERSGLPEFSTPMYPWGFPLLLSPFVAVLGTDLDRLVIAQAIFFCWFLAVWYRLARPRVGLGLAMGGLVVIALSPQFVRWAELIQSEVAFMAVAVTGLVVLDSRRVRQSLVTAGAPWWPPVTAGVVAAGAFTVRREGLAVIGAIGVAQVVALSPLSPLSPLPRLPRLPPGAGTRRFASEVWALVRPLLGRLAVPFVAALGTIGVLQVVLPSTLVPSYEGTGLVNVVRFAPEHLGHVMESVGLQRVGTDGPTVLGSSALGVLAVVVFLTLVAMGIALAVWRHPRRELPIVAFTVAALLIGGSFRTPGSRYVAIIAPMVMIFALVALRELSRRLPRRRAGAAVALALVAALAIGNLVQVVNLATAAREFARDGSVVWGPDHPDSVEMFAAVERLTEPDDVIGFFKARSMTQRTDRRAIQVTELHPVERNADVLTHVVLQNTADDAFTVATDRGRYTELWSNPTFTLHQLTPTN